jgi:hypothetical protein
VDEWNAVTGARIEERRGETERETEGDIKKQRDILPADKLKWQ